MLHTEVPMKGKHEGWGGGLFIGFFWLLVVFWGGFFRCLKFFKITLKIRCLFKIKIVIFGLIYFSLLFEKFLVVS